MATESFAIQRNYQITIAFTEPFAKVILQGIIKTVGSWYFFEGKIVTPMIASQDYRQTIG